METYSLHLCIIFTILSHLLSPPPSPPLPLPLTQLLLSSPPASATAFPSSHFLYCPSPTPPPLPSPPLPSPPQDEGIPHESQSSRIEETQAVQDQDDTIPHSKERGERWHLGQGESVSDAVEAHSCVGTDSEFSFFT